MLTFFSDKSANRSTCISNLVKVYHKCSFVSPCRHGGACEAIEWIYQCNCTVTDYYGPMCETGKNYNIVCVCVCVCLQVCVTALSLYPFVKYLLFPN